MCGGCCKRDIAGAWQHVNGGFLLALLAGIATSIFTLARLVSWVLENHPVPLWAFFFGLILASALVLLRQVGQWNDRRVWFPCWWGIAFALAIALSPVVGLDGRAAGAVYSCRVPRDLRHDSPRYFRQLYPGAAGDVRHGAGRGEESLDLLFLAVFVIGGRGACGCCVSPGCLHWLLHRFHQGTMALLTGFLFGSLAVVWPWKRVLAWVEGSDGATRSPPSSCQCRRPNSW